MVAIPYNTLCGNRDCGHPLETHLPRWQAGQPVEIFEDEVERAPEGRYGCDFADPADITHAVCGCLRFTILQPVDSQPTAPPGYRGPDTTDYEVRRIAVGGDPAVDGTVLVLWWSGRVTWTTPDVPF